MPGNHAPSDKADSPQMLDALDRWDDEGGAMPDPAPETLAAQLTAVEASGHAVSGRRRRYRVKRSAD